MFFVDSGYMQDIELPICWQLDVARFLAPLTFTYTAIQAFGILFSEQIQDLRLTKIRNHIIICGLGDKGDIIAKRFLEAGFKVVIIEMDDDNDLIKQNGENGAFVITGDATDPQLLLKAGLRRAKYLLSVCGDDGINTEIAVTAKKLSKVRPVRHYLTCIAHIVDPQLYLLLRKFEIESVDQPSFRFVFFNIYDRGSFAMLKEFAVPKRSLIVGFGRLGKTLLLSIAKNRQQIKLQAAEKLHFTVIDRDACNLVDSMRHSWSFLNEKCTIEPIEIDIDSFGFEKAGFLFDEMKNCRFDNIYICLGTDSFNLSAALKLQRHLITYKVPIIIRMNHDAGLADLIKRNEISQFENLFTFGLLDRTCRLEMILGGSIEIIASSIHADYAANEIKNARTIESNPALASWDELPEHLKELNRMKADHIGTKLKAIRCGLIPLMFSETVAFEFTEEENEILAKMEHKRWLDHSLLEKWKYGDTKDVSKKTDPHILDWDQLPEEVKKKNREAITALPHELTAAGFAIYRFN